MQTKLLLTSFRTWKARQVSNASDDLLQYLLAEPSWARSLSLHVLRQLPVDFQDAPIQVICEIQAIQPDLVILFGMAASRKLLNLEHQAIAGEKIRTTSLNLKQIRKGLTFTRVSKNAGRFVCNGLYYAVLSHLQVQQTRTACLFIHVPILTSENTNAVVQDFQTTLIRILAEIHATNACLSVTQRDTITV